ncbi:MAG: DUF262 domain-containing protein [Chloroflexi bacterium]|nr:DUF262 domain-containing protein [Chloroflexota bacterium]
MLQSYPISDLVRWMKEKTLVLNPDFQRRSIWPQPAKSYFINTLLEGLPIPNIYMRSVTDPKDMRTYREVVDGQQRLRTILDFVENRIRLGASANTYAGMKYEDLSECEQKRLLAYQIGVVQLFGATDDKVLDIFNRLNAYGLSLNSQELRHGRFQGGKYKGVFRRAVIEASNRWSVLWDRHKIVSVSARVRMADDELMAQMLGVLLEGVQDGGQPTINRLYNKYDEALPEDSIVTLDSTLEYIVANLADVLNSRIGSAPHFLMLFAAVSHALLSIPAGDIGESGLPCRDGRALSDLSLAVQNLETLAEVLDLEESEVPSRFVQFKQASARTTHRIRSRAIRFLAFYEALLPDTI